MLEEEFQKKDTNVDSKKTAIKQLKTQVSFSRANILRLTQYVNQMSFFFYSF